MLGSWHPCLCMKPVHAHELHKWQRSEVVLGLSNANTALRPKDRLDRPEAMKGNMHIFPSSNSECLSFIFVHFPRICGLYNDCFIYICVYTYNYMYIYIYMLSTAFGAVFGRHCWLLLGGWACLVPAFLQIKRLLVLQRTSPQKALCFIVFVKKLIHGTKLPLIADKRYFIYCIYSISKKNVLYMYMYKNHNLQPSKRLSPPPSSFWWNGVFHAGYRATKSVERYGLWNLGFAG